MKLLRNSYGKARVRVMKVTRRGRRHSVKELSISIMLQGKFEACYLGDDNRLVVATDSMKNTVNVLARESLGAETEEFGAGLARHFLKTYRHVDQVEIRLEERCWERMANGGRPHPHAFVSRDSARHFSKITATRESTLVESGVEDLLVLKTTASGFKGFLRDKFTTLRETDDRLLCTKINAVWKYSQTPAAWSSVNKRIIDSLLAEFASAYSPSVQATLFLMGKAALNAAPEISELSLALPNQHCLPIDLSPFGIANKNELFVPTDEPHGLIEATIVR